MIVAVTGAGGFVGRAVLADLAAHDIAARPLVRRATGLAGEVATGSLETQALDPAALAGVDVVVHLASRVPVPGESEADADAGFAAVNVDGTARLLDAAVAAQVSRFVFVSSIKAVGERSHPGSPLDNHTAPAPEDAYGRSKLAAEQLVRTRCEAAGIAWTVIRPPMVVGPRAKGNFAALVKLVRSGIPLPLASIDNRRSTVFVDNLASAIVRACTAPGAANRILTIADQTLSTPGLIRAIAAAARSPARLVPFPAGVMAWVATKSGRSGIADRLLGSLELDSAESLRALDWSPPIPPDEALRRSIE